MAISLISSSFMMAFLRFSVFCKHLCAWLGGIRDRSFEPQREFLF
jgi:hypothetical protein